MPFAATLSTADDTADAVHEVCTTLPADLRTGAELVVAFFSPHHADRAGELARSLAERLQPGCLFGCVGESIVGGAREVEHSPALALWAGSWAGRVQLEPFHLVPRQTPDGLSLLGWPDGLLEANPADCTLLLVGDPFTFPAVEVFLPSLNDDYPGLRAMGGMASGGQPGQTALVLNGEAFTSGGVGVLLRGPAGLRTVVSQGCRPIGRSLVITEAREHVIMRLGGQTPLEVLRALYQELDARDRELFQHGLHIGLVINEYQESFSRGDFLVRNLYGLDRDSGALAVTDRVRVGQTVQFHVRDPDSADEELRTLLRGQRGTGSAGALLFTCNGRGSRMFGVPDHDAAVLAEELGPLAVAGFFAAGELGPIGGRNFIHGFTASVAIFGEGEG